MLNRLIVVAGTNNSYLLTDEDKKVITWLKQSEKNQKVSSFVDKVLKTTELGKEIALEEEDKITIREMIKKTLHN